MYFEANVNITVDINITFYPKYGKLMYIDHEQNFTIDLYIINIIIIPIPFEIFESRYIARSCVKVNVNVNLMRCGNKHNYNVLKNKIINQYIFQIINHSKGLILLHTNTNMKFGCPYQLSIILHITSYSCYDQIVLQNLHRPLYLHI